MKCPKCNIDLNITITSGVEIDFCPGCRGVWLDRGELEKIIERSELSYRSKAESDHYPDSHDKHDHHDQKYGNYQHRSYGDRDHHSKSNRGFLSELFDF
jgi:Zn-finger nucleic acid-binding protein